MIGKIAFNTFAKGEYFFRQEDLQAQVKDYICNLPEASADPDVLRLDSEAVLKAIEHHHGLLVERARYIYSFSHLTFQEYFTAREIERERHFERLIENISNPRWKEVFYLTAEMLRRSDDFLKMMKDGIDGMLARDEKLQTFLEWIEHKSISVRSSLKVNIVRAYYYALAYALEQRRTYAMGIYDGRRDIDVSLAYSRPFLADKNIDYRLVNAIDSNFVCEGDFSIDKYLSNTLAIDRVFYFDIANCPTNTFDMDLSEAVKLDMTLALDIIKKLDGALHKSLRFLNNQFPDYDRLKKWEYWNSNRKQWIDTYCQTIIDRRNIGHDWQFTKKQVELLNQYYAANLLLVECMNRSYVSKQVREEIESTMLLPSKK
jgi:predicted NACHT family NTPase